jgi:hypothetical protein
MLRLPDRRPQHYITSNGLQVGAESADDEGDGSTPDAWVPRPYRVRQRRARRNEPRLSATSTQIDLMDVDVSVPRHFVSTIS